MKDVIRILRTCYYYCNEKGWQKPADRAKISPISLKKKVLQCIKEDDEDKGVALIPFFEQYVPTGYIEEQLTHKTREITFSTLDDALRYMEPIKEISILIYDRETNTWKVMIPDNSGGVASI
jgi:hypothetical protein